MKTNVLLTSLIVAACFLQPCSTACAIQLLGSPSESKRQVERYQYEVGETLEKSLPSDCVAFIGQVESVQELAIETDPAVNPQSRIKQIISLKVTKWLMGETENRDSFMAFERSYRLSDPRMTFDRSWEPWRLVDAQVGKRVLVIFSQERDGKIRLRRVISDEALFQSVQDVFQFNRMVKNNPAEVIRMPDILGQQENYVMAGYVASYLRMTPPQDYVDETARVLSKLLSRTCMHEIGWYYIRSALTRILLNEERYPITKQTRDSILQELVTKGTSNDVELANVSISVLVRLADRKKLDLRQFVTNEQRLKLRNIYFAKQTPEQRGQHPEFELQLEAP